MEDIKEIDLSSWVLSGEGGTAFTYSKKDDDSIMLKLYKDGVDDIEAIKEYETTKHVEELGFTIPKAISLVRSDGKLGVIFEKVKNKKSFSRMMTDDESTIKYCAKEMAYYAKKLASTPCIPEYFQNKKDMMKDIVNKRYFSDDINDALTKKLLSIKDENTCVHGDFQPGNFLDSDGKTYMIDLGNFGYGSHMFDIGALYFSCYIIITEEEKIELFHMPIPRLRLFFDEFAKANVGEDKGDLKAFYKDASEYATLFMAFAYHILGEPVEKKHIYESVIREIYGLNP